MSSFAGENLFASGPHAFGFGPWERSTHRRGFAGVNGEVVLDLGLRSRQITQTGRLRANSAAALHELLDDINACCDGAAHTLVDNYGQSYSRVILERFGATTPLRHSRGFYCDYEIEYRQLP